MGSGFGGPISAASTVPPLTPGEQAAASEAILDAKEALSLAYNRVLVRVRSFIHYDRTRTSTRL